MVANGFSTLAPCGMRRAMGCFWSWVMRPSGRRWVGWLLVIMVVLGGEVVARPSAASEASGNADAAAAAHFNKGDQHFNKGEFREAHDEYRQSLAFKKTRAAMVNAASCLRQLGRYDEAMDQYDELRREFHPLPAAFEAKVAPALVELQGLVGMLVVKGDAPVGSSLFVDDRFRAKLPLENPLRVSVGNHRIRIEKETFEPILGEAEINAGQENVVVLEARSKKGRLVVSEKHNWPLVVQLDGQDVGVTPWRGLVDPGEHHVRLHGYMRADALAACEAVATKPGELAEAAQDRAKMAAKEEVIRVALYQESTVVLGAEELDASLKIDSTPLGGSVRIDGVETGKTPWEGRLALGEHIIEIRATGHLPVTQTVRLEKRKQRELSVVLPRERKVEVPGVLTPRNVGAGIAFGIGILGFGGFAVTGSLALATQREVKSHCNGSACPPTQQEGLDMIRTLGKASTAGLIVGSVGAAAGTIVLLVARSGGKGRTPQAARGVTLQVGVAGPSAFRLEGSF